MRVCVLAPSLREPRSDYDPGPVRVIRNLCRSLAKCPEVELVALRVRLTPCELAVTETEGYPLFECWIGGIGRFFKGERFDVLQTFSSTATNMQGVYAGRTAKRNGAVWVDSLLGFVKEEHRFGYPHRPESFLFEMIRLNEADALVVPSQFALERLNVLESAIPAQKAYVIHLGVDDEWIEAGASVDAKSREDTRLRIVSVGSIAPIKGQDRLLHSFSNAEIEGSIRFIGPEVDMAYAKKLRGISRDVGRGKTVEFMGKLTHGETCAAVKASNVFALLSRYDLFSSAVVEAMALQIAPIVTATVGAKDLVDDGQSGYIISDPESKSLAGLLEQISQAPGRHQARGKKARERAAKQRWTSVATEYADVYAGMLRRDSREVAK